jgi:Zn-dependent protease/CBS domain-containing protein
VIGRAAGAPIVLNPGWLVATVVLALVIAPPASTMPGLRGVGSLLVGLAAALLLNGSVLLHELAHAVVARWRGLPVREIALTLTGGHTEMGRAPTPATAALVAVAGPLANLAVAGAAWWAWRVVDAPPVGSLVLLVLAWASAFVAAFNLLPGLPMDGGWVLEALVWRVTGRRTAGTRAAAWVGRAVAVALLLWAVAYPLATGGRASLATVVWSALIGAMLWSGASAFLRHADRTDLVDGLSVAALARPAVAVPVGSSVADVAAAAGRGGAAAAPVVVVVGPDGAPAGWVDPAALAAVPAGRRATTPAAAVVVPMPAAATVDAALEGRAALTALVEASRHSALLAVRDGAGRVVGVVHHADVAAVLRPRG